MNKQELVKLIEEYETIVVYRHVNPDPDALGSQIGLTNLLKTLYPKKTVLKVGTTVDNLAWLGEMDSDVSSEGALAIILDTSNLERIDGNYHRANKIVKIDHHPLQDVFGDLSMIDTSYSSTSEMLVDLFKEELKRANVETLNKLYAGIIGDTGRFMYNNTTQRTLELAGYLVGLGAEAYDVNVKQSNISLTQANLIRYAYAHMQYLNEQTVTLVITYPYLDSNKIDASDTYITTTALQQLEDGKLALIAVENEDGSYRVHLRSKSITINELAKKYHGGGHPLASGATARNLEELKQLMNDLGKLTERND